MSHTLKKTLTLTFLTAVLLVAGTADAAVFRFGDTVPEQVRAGKTLLVPVYVVPEYPGEEITLAGLSLSFTQSTLWMRSFTLAPEWLAVSDSRSTELSNERGVFTTAAGFAEKAFAPVYLGVLDFVATHEGMATLYLDNISYIFGKNNRNILTQGWLPQKSLTVVPALQSNSALPEQLFDIGIAVGSNQYEYGVTPSVRLSFQSFGSIPTPVDISGRVVSDKGVVVFEWKDAIVVETEFAYIKKVAVPELSSGYYIVLVTTNYSGDITDNWRDTFTVLRHTEPYYVYGGILLAIIIGIGTIWFSRPKKRKQVAF